MPTENQILINKETGQKAIWRNGGLEPLSSEEESFMQARANLDAQTGFDVANEKQTPSETSNPGFMGTVAQAIQDASNDPIGSVARSANKLYQSVGGSEAWGNRLERDLQQLPESIGPLGTEFAGLAAQPRAAQVTKQGLNPINHPSFRVGADKADDVARAVKLGKNQSGLQMKISKLDPNVVTPEKMVPHYERLISKLDSEAIDVDPDLMDMASKVLEKIKTATSNPQSLKQLHSLRRKAAMVAARPGDEGYVGKLMKGTVDDLIKLHPKGASFQKGISGYAKAAKAEKISEAYEAAKNSVQWQRGDQAGALRNQFRRLLTNKGTKHLWNDQERKAMKEIQHFSAMEGLGGFGSMSPMGFTLGRVTESILGIPPGMGMAIGVPARSMANSNKVNATEKLIRQVLNAGGVESVRQLQTLPPETINALSSTKKGANMLVAFAMRPSQQLAARIAAYSEGNK